MHAHILFLDQWSSSCIKHTEIARLVEIGVLEEDYTSGWESPTFAIAKKNGTIRVVSDFRKLNSLFKLHPFPIPKIGDMIHSMEGFTIATALDLNTDNSYYHIKPDADAQKLCTTIFACVKYKYKRLSMGIKIATFPDVFQNVMSKLIQDMKYVKTYLHDLLIFCNNNFNDHLLKLEMVLARLSTSGMRVNASKSKFSAE
jgi:Reverse transcriptase (RNA-dependent DNA polymerase)